MYSTVAQDSYENLQTTDKAVQFIKDNVDYDMGTVDGHVTYPRKRIIATITPSITDVKRICCVTVTPEDILPLGGHKLSDTLLFNIPGKYLKPIVSDLTLQIWAFCGRHSPCSF